MTKPKKGPIGEQVKRLLSAVLNAERMAFLNMHDDLCKKCPYRPKPPKKSSKFK